MEIALRYVTRFRYHSPVWDSHNALRAAPRTDEYQDRVDYHLTVTPAARHPLLRRPVGDGRSTPSGVRPARLTS